jgi:hypothetical protein
LKFSADGKTIMLTTNGNIIRLIDAFTGQLKHTLSVCRKKKWNSIVKYKLNFIFSRLGFYKYKKYAD